MSDQIQGQRIEVSDILSAFRDAMGGTFIIIRMMPDGSSQASAPLSFKATPAEIEAAINSLYRKAVGVN